MRWRTGIAVACVLAILAPAGPAARAHDPDELRKLRELRARLEQKRDALQDVNRERTGVLNRLAESDARRDELTSRIGDLSSRLSAAERRLAAIRRNLDRTRLELLRWTRRLETARRELRVQEATLDNRAATAYKIGPAGYLELILGAGDLRSLIDRAEFLKKVLEADTSLLLGIETTRGMLAEGETRVREYESRVEGHWDKVREKAREIARLREERLSLRAQVDEEIAQRRVLLKDIEAERAKYVAAVRELEAQSAAIEASLQSGGSTGSGQAGGQLYWPTAGPVTSGFGWRTHPIFGTRRFHAGVDIDGACGQPIWAAARGRVISAGWMGGYGLATVIDHGDGLATLYAHQSSIGVSSGQRVRRAQHIGNVGTTGWSTGCHLHFEVRVNGEPVDPMPYLT